MSDCCNLIFSAVGAIELASNSQLDLLLHFGAEGPLLPQAQHTSTAQSEEKIKSIWVFAGYR
jgi:hypothetical protein